MSKNNLYKVSIKFSAANYEEYSKIMNKLQSSTGTYPKYSKRLNATTYEAVLYFDENHSATNATNKLKKLNIFNSVEFDTTV